MATSQATPNGTVKFQTNVPEIIALAYAQGREVTSQYGGDQVMFSLDDGRRMYLPPFVAAKIYAAGIPAHREFALCKREVTHGNRRSIEWIIEDANASVNPCQEATPARTQSEHTQVATPRSKAPQTQNSAALAIAAQLAESLAQPPHDNAIDAMIAAHCRAIDVAIAAETYGRTKNFNVEYTAEDVRAIAATIFIEQNKEGRR